MKDKLSVEWKEVLITPDTTCKATVDGLKENQVVQFRVRAANKAGCGEPSEPTDTHVVKHRNCKNASDEMKKKDFYFYIQIKLLNLCFNFNSKTENRSQYHENCHN